MSGVYVIRYQYNIRISLKLIRSKFCERFIFAQVIAMHALSQQASYLIRRYVGEFNPNSFILSWVLVMDRLTQFLLFIFFFISCTSNLFYRQASLFNFWLLICYCAGTERYQCIDVWNKSYSYRYLYRGIVKIGWSQVLNFETDLNVQVKSASHLIIKVILHLNFFKEFEYLLLTF